MSAPFRPPLGYVKHGEVLRVAYMFSGQLDTTAYDPRVNVDSVFTGINGSFPSCRLDVRPHKGPGVDQIDLPDLPAYLNSEERVVVYAEGDGANPAPSERRFLFDGFPAMSRVHFAGRPGMATLALGVECQSHFQRLARDAQVNGRFMPARQDPEGADGRFPVQHFARQPAIFNFDHAAGRYARRGNRHPQLHTVNGLENVPVFTYDDDPAAEFWTYADALAYLLACYHQPLLDRDPQYPLRDGNGLARATAALDAANHAGVGVGRPVDPPASGTLSWKDLMLCKCAELPLEGMDLAAALLALVESAGICVQQHTRNDGSGQPVTELLFSTYTEGGPWANRSANEVDAGDERGVLAELARSKDGYVELAMGLGEFGSQEPITPDQPISNEVTAGQMLFDSASIIRDVTVLCGPEKYEVIVGPGKNVNGYQLGLFKPLWVPDTTFGDKLTSDAAITAQVELMETADDEATGDSKTLWDRYTTRGWLYGVYRDVGRYWGLDEAGELTGDDASAEMGRDNGDTDVWTALAYQYKFDWIEQCGVPYLRDPATGAFTRQWAMSRRRILTPLHTDSEGGALPPKLECSWDSGGHWTRYPGGVRFDHERIALWLTDESLVSEHLRCPQEAEGEAENTMAGKTLYEAILRGTFRLRLLCTVEGDDRAGYYPAEGESGALLRLGDLFRVEVATTAAAAAMASGPYRLDQVVENGQATAMARRYRELGRNEVISSSLTIPWLSKKWLPGDLCRGIYPRGVDFGRALGSDTIYPMVVGVHWQNSPGDQETEVILGDLRAAKQRR